MDKPKSKLVASRNTFASQRSVKKDLNTPKSYLENISIGMDFTSENPLLTILYSASNLYMSCVVIKIENTRIQELYSSDTEELVTSLIRCYRGGEKFFEMPLTRDIKFIDIHQSNIAVIFDDETEAFHSIDVGMPENNEEIEVSEGQEKLTRYEHEFELDGEEIKGFKLGHFTYPEKRNLKAIIWTDTKAKIYPYNANPDNSEEDDLTDNRQNIIIDEDEVQIKQIYDFGVYHKIVPEYDNQEKPPAETMIIVDNDDNLQVLRGVKYGRKFEKFITYTRVEDVDEEADDTKRIKRSDIKEIHDLIAVSTTKVVSVVEIDIDLSKNKGFDCEEGFCIQVLELDNSEKETGRLLPGRDLEFHQSQLEEVKENIRKSMTVDNKNEQFYILNFHDTAHASIDKREDNRKESIKYMAQMPIDNSYSKKADPLIASAQVVMNFVGNNLDKSQQDKGLSKGLLFNDFIYSDNILVVIHGRVLSLFDLQDKREERYHHLIHPDAQKIKDDTLYQFDHEPVAIWNSDREVSNILERWRLIVAFRNGDVQEIQLGEKPSLQKYLVDGKDSKRSAFKLPGKIHTVFKNSNSKNMPIYFKIIKDVSGKPVFVFASIEFTTHTYREFDIPAYINIEQAKFIIFDTKADDFWWQEIGIFYTDDSDTAEQDPQNDDEQKSLEQKFIHAKIRITQIKLKGKPDFVILNREDLSSEIPDIRTTIDQWVDGRFIYLVFKKQIIRYALDSNSFTEFSSFESLSRFQVFENKAYYWRSVLGGTNDNRFVSRIYFDVVEDSSTFKSRSNNPNFLIFDGVSPHMERLHYDQMSESIACFTDFYQFIVFPLLHLKRIKVKIAGKRNCDPDILATKLDESSSLLVTLSSDNILRGWNLKTGKYILSQVNIQAQYNLKNFTFHQRINDELTLLREKKAVDRDLYVNLEEDAQVQNEEGIETYRYRIVQIIRDLKRDSNEEVNDNGELATELQQYDIKVISSFVGPHVEQVNFGLFSNDAPVGDESKRILAFFFQDSQSRDQIIYFEITDKVFSDEEYKKNNTIQRKDTIEGPAVNDDKFFQLKQRSRQSNPDKAKLSRHSPNFEQIIVDNVQKDYTIEDTKENNRSYMDLPSTLNKISIEVPNFLTNDTLLYLTDDKILLGYNFKTGQKQDKENKLIEEEFTISHCSFPGSGERQNLATMLKVGNYIIGENCLTYRANPKFEKFEPKNNQLPQPSSQILPNSYNYFFEEINRQFPGDDQEEVRIIQAHYKTKIQFLEDGYYGYLFSQKELKSGKTSNEIHIITTFSYYSFRTLNQLRDKEISYNSLGQEVLRDLAYHQLQNGKTILHYLQNNKLALEYFFNTVKPDDSTLDDAPFYVPLLCDKDNRTALDFALNHPKIEKPDGKVPGSRNNSISEYDLKNQLQDKEIQQETRETGEEMINRRSAELILQQVGSYPFGLFNVQMVQQIEIMIKSGLSEISNFFAQIAKSPSFLSQIDRAKVEIDDTCGAKVIDVDSLWSSDPTQITSRLEEKGKESQMVNLRVINLPKIHHFKTQEEMRVYKALADTENDLLFEEVTVRSLIEHKFYVTRRYIITRLLLPYLLYLTTVVLYTWNDFEVPLDPTVLMDSYDEQYWQKTVIKSILYVFLVYFLGIEIYQGYTDGLADHLGDFWNYLDVLPPIFIFIADLIQYFNDDEQQIDQYIRVMFCIVVLAMWLRFLYFFRIIKETSYFIRMIVEVIKDMSQFFIIFFFTLIAFAHMFYIFFLNIYDPKQPPKLDPTSGDEVENILGNPFDAVIKVYLMGLGDTSIISDFDTSIQYYVANLLYVLATVLVVIVLLNLLIAIVGETFGRVRDSRNVFMYKDMVSLIVENQFLVSNISKDKMNGGRYLLLVEKDDIVQSPDMVIENRFAEINSQFKSLQTKLNLQQQATAFSQERILQAVKKIQEDLTQFKESSQQSRSPNANQEEDGEVTN